MDHACELARTRHVDAVIVLRAQVQGGEVAVVEARRQRGVAGDQGRGAVVVALGLEDLLAFDGAELADRAIDRADPITWRQRPRARLQGAGEEVIEAGVLRDVGLGSLAHVDAVPGDEAADDARGVGAAAPVGHHAGKRRHGLLGHQVLRRHRKALGQQRRQVVGRVRHRPISAGVPSRAALSQRRARSTRRSVWPGARRRFPWACSR